MAGSTACLYRHATATNVLLLKNRAVNFYNKQVFYTFGSMKYLFKPLFIALVFAHVCFAQDSKSTSVVSWVNKGSYRYIPKQTFSDSVTTVTGSTTDESRELHLSWLSACTDGMFKMYITPEQIFLTTSHSNATPNRILWAIDIDPSKFDYIVDGFKQTDDLSTKVDDTQFPKSWANKRPADSTLRRFCESELDHQVSQSFEFINSLLPKRVAKINFPAVADLHKVRSKLFGAQFVKKPMANAKK